MNAIEKPEKSISFSTAPVLIATWPGPGNVGTMALDYLRYKFETEWFAELDMSGFPPPASIPVKNGRLVRPAPPKGVFYFKKDPALILFECDTHFPEKESLSIVNYLINLAKTWKVTRVFTLGASPIPMDHTQPSEIRYAASEEGFMRELENLGFTPIPEGEISGPLALVPTIAAGQNLKAACLLGTMPVYAGPFSYPKASFEILKGLELVLNIRIDMSQLEEAIRKMEITFTTIEKQLQEHLPFLLSGEAREHPEPGEAEETFEQEPVPGDDEEVMSGPVREKIERLFEEATRDIAKAVDLKKELDRWGGFKEYEDRFLDLFKKEGEDGGSGSF